MLLTDSHIIFTALVSRQFVDMSRIRIEGLLAAFPKLIGSGKQHTYVETENVRYVYQPIDLLYLLLVTNKQSNILDDLDTLRILSKVVSFFLHNNILMHNAFRLTKISESHILILYQFTGLFLTLYDFKLSRASKSSKIVVSQWCCCVYFII